MYQNKITHYCFDTSGVFAQYEEQAIDGQLDYSEYPPEEYRYFSKLSRLGYNNRHMGWSKEICEQKQEEYRKVCGRSYCKDYLDYICVNPLGERIKCSYLTSGFPNFLEPSPV